MSRRNSGLTLVEVMVVTAITATILAATSRVMVSSQQALQLTAVEADLAAQALSVLDRIANELKDAQAASISPGTPGGHPSITFQRCMGYGASGIVLGNTIKYEMYTDPKNGRVICRRTENGQTSDLCDSLIDSTSGLQFLGSYGDPVAASAAQAATGTAPAYDVWQISVSLSRTTYSIARTTQVQLRNRGY